mmetsp:Transcript_30790/g.96804  ORF Transcript_30790/g.96804 Transcript_30790/m.96804 type:complete len:223 (+) Transcript_30790:124-792(+)
MRCRDHRDSALLDLRTTEGRLDVGGRLVPVDLREHLIHVALLGHQDGALAVRHGLEELEGQAARAHLGSEPHPALAIVHNLLRLVDAVADAALAHEHGVLHLLHQALDANGDVLLADGAGRRALPEPGVALEALRRELAVEELHDQLRDNSALRRVATAARGELRVEAVDVRIRDVVLAAAARLQGNRAPRANPGWGRAGRGRRHKCDQQLCCRVGGRGQDQ